MQQLLLMYKNKPEIFETSIDGDKLVVYILAFRKQLIKKKKTPYIKVNIETLLNITFSSWLDPYSWHTKYIIDCSITRKTLKFSSNSDPHRKFNTFSCQMFENISFSQRVGVETERNGIRSYLINYIIFNILSYFAH